MIQMTTAQMLTLDELRTLVELNHDTTDIAALNERESYRAAIDHTIGSRWTEVHETHCAIYADEPTEAVR